MSVNTPADNGAAPAAGALTAETPPAGETPYTGVRLELSEVAAHCPVHLAEVVWYEARTSSRGGHTVKRRAIFYLKTVAWKDHPWGDEDRKGADFSNQWTLETKYALSDSWSSDGRTGEERGWSGLTLKDATFHETALGATLALEKKIDDEIARHESILSDLARIKAQCVEAQV